MRILIFGSKGYIGTEFLTLYGDNAIASTVDIADAQAVCEELDTHKPDIVINAAGKTGRPNIDWCEDHKEETVRSNVTGPLVLVEECMKRSIYMVHMSSGCIYEGDNGGEGFGEDDAPNFTGSFYSRTKIWSEAILKEFPVLILRIRMPFDGSGSERTLISKLLKYDRVIDVQNSVTYIPDFLNASNALIERKATGIYNIVNPGPTTPFAIMSRYAEVVDTNHTFEKLLLDDLPTVTRAGRSNCILSTQKLKQEGISMKPVDEAIDEAVHLLKDA